MSVRSVAVATCGPTIREMFDTHRFADHKERVIGLLARVVRVSVDTVHIVQGLERLAR